MKISRLTPENHKRVSALIRDAFPAESHETQLFENLHRNGRHLIEWVCLHRNHIIAYIAFSNAYVRAKVVGLHLGPLAVNPDFQGTGIGTELLNFALRQKEIRESTLFVHGAPDFFRRFGFERWRAGLCPFDENNEDFLGLRNSTTIKYTVGYEPEFKEAMK
jgi:putative acetyltransferase